MKRFFISILSVFHLFYGSVLEARLNDGANMNHHQLMIAAYSAKAGDTILDVGCCWGAFSITYSRIVGPTGVVVAYECNPYVYNNLKGWIPTQTEGRNNIITRGKAASNSTGNKLLMKVYPNSTGSECGTVEPLLMKEWRMPGNTEIVEVETEALDDL